jgi:hypothetical protein
VQDVVQAGFDAGADTIAEHLVSDPAITKVPAVSTIWRILTAADLSPAAA